MSRDTTTPGKTASSDLKRRAAVRGKSHRRRGEEPALPQGFLDRMSRLLGDEYPSFVSQYHETPVAGLRANTLKIAPDTLRTLLGSFTHSPIPEIPAAFTVSEEAGLGQHPYHAAGLYYLQDPSAMAVAHVLAPQPGECVLDLAAAPGGKATHIASLLANQGLLVANEIHHKRVWDLAENLERWGATNTAITNETSARIADHFEEYFDRVLLDAPCSGEGMFRKSPVARQEWAPELVEGCAVRQISILVEAARTVRPGGFLVYSTCTFAPEENEGTVARFLDGHRDFELVEPVRWVGMSPGRPDWLAEPGDPELLRTIRLWPHLWRGEGHFVALFRRREANGKSRPRSWRLPRLPAQVERAYRTFCEEQLTRVPAEDRLAIVGSYLYQIPPDLPDLTGLRFIHPGWWLGTIRKDRFEPSHALALALRPVDVRRAAGFTISSSELHAYLRGEGIRCEGEDGWVLVAVDGFPLGWGKRVRGTLKSHYPRGLRWKRDNQ